MNVPQPQRGPQEPFPTGYGVGPGPGAAGWSAPYPPVGSAQPHRDSADARFGIVVGAVDAIFLLGLDLTPGASTTGVAGPVVAVLLNLLNVVAALAALAGGVLLLRGNAQARVMMGAGAALAVLLQFYYFGELLGEGALLSGLFGAANPILWAALLSGLLAIVIVVLAFRPYLDQPAQLAESVAAWVPSGIPQAFSQATAKIWQQPRPEEQTVRLPRQTNDSPQWPEEEPGEKEQAVVKVAEGYSEPPTAAIEKSDVPLPPPGLIPEQSRNDDSAESSTSSSDEIQWPS
jgi:hypothetical protein